MNQMALEERINRLQKGMKSTGLEVDRYLLELQVEVDRLRLELTALKNFMKVMNPSFAEQFPQILERTLHEVDPEAH